MVNAGAGLDLSVCVAHAENEVILASSGASKDVTFDPNVRGA